MRLSWKVTLLSFGIVLFSILIGGIVILGNMTRMKEKELGQRLLITARTVAEMPDIRQNVVSADGVKAIEPIVERIRIINDVTYIVVMDMDRRRLSHPLEANVGTVFEGKDGEAAFAEHSFVSKAAGDMGTSLRAFVPIMNAEHQQIGVVMAGRLLPGIWETIGTQNSWIVLTLGLSLLFGVWGSYRLATHIKKQMYDYEPQELARIFRERTAAFQGMQEGVIAIDSGQRITIFNDSAKKIFGIQSDAVGREIHEVLPDTRLPEILELKHPVYNRELQVGNTLIWSSRFPIKVGGRTVGAMAIFQDRTEVAKMAEELTGVRAFVDALRVQNHEYMNKLHTIAGLIQLDQKEKALDYVFEVSDRQEELTRFLKERLCDDSISGLLLSKISRGSELGIEVTLDRRSRLVQFPQYLDRHDFVLVIGNLIENAFDALAEVDREKKELFVSLEQDDQVLSLLVEDNGCGMDSETQARMTARGFSTKTGAERGIGLHLVSSIVAKGRGELRVESAPGEGTAFLATFPMKGGERHG